MPHYSWNGYYTHRQRAGEPPRRSLMDRLRVPIAWRADRGVPLTTATMMDHVPPAASVCEIGCGDASLLAELADRGVSVVGVDPDPQARNAAPKHVRILDGSAESLPASLSLGTYDLVIMSHALEHCIDPLTAMHNVYALLKPQAIALIAVPNCEALGLRYSGVAWRWLDVPRHLNFFSAHSLRLFCEQAGLSVGSVEYDGYCRQFSDEWINEEERIRAEFGLDRRTSSWRLLLRTIFASCRRKYDTVRLTAIKISAKTFC